MKTIIAMIAVLGFVSFANAEDHAAPAAAHTDTHAAAPAAAAPAAEAPAAAAPAAEAPKKVKKAKKTKAPKATKETAAH
jgi:hypothetical protein